MTTYSKEALQKLADSQKDLYHQSLKILNDVKTALAVAKVESTLTGIPISDEKRKLFISILEEAYDNVSKHLLTWNRFQRELDSLD